MNEGYFLVMVSIILKLQYRVYMLILTYISTFSLKRCLVACRIEYSKQRHSRLNLWSHVEHVVPMVQRHCLFAKWQDRYCLGEAEIWVPTRMVETSLQNSRRSFRQLVCRCNYSPLNWFTKFHLFKLTSKSSGLCQSWWTLGYYNYKNQSHQGRFG